MKRLKSKIQRTLILLSAVGFASFAGAYLLLHSQITANFLARYLSNQHYSVEIGAYSLQMPNEIILKQVKLVDKETNQQVMQGEKITLSFTPKILWKQGAWDCITIKNGQLEMGSFQKIGAFIKAKQLQLQQVAITWSNGGGQALRSMNVNGSIALLSKITAPKSQSLEFEFTAEKILFADLLLKNVALSGFQENNKLYISSFGGNINNGFFIGRAKRLANQSWQVNELQVNRINLEDERIFHLLAENYKNIPKIIIQHFNLVDSSLNLPTLKIEKAHLEVNHLVYENEWKTKDIVVNFDAESIRLYDELFIAPECKLYFTSQNMVVEKATSYWNKGFISLEGEWQKGNLILNNLSISGVRYTLPTDWLAKLYQARFPDFLSELTINNLILNPSLVLDTDSSFPMQFSALEASGHNLVLIKNNQFDIWQGKMTLNANDAAINGVGIQYPELNINVTDTPSNQAENPKNRKLKMAFNTLISKGILEGSSSIDFKTHKLNHITLHGDAIDSGVLASWHLVENPPAKNHFQLHLSGSYNPLILDGKMTIKEENQQKSYQVNNNRIVQRK